MKKDTVMVVAYSHICKTTVTISKDSKDYAKKLEDNILKLKLNGNNKVIKKITKEGVEYLVGNERVEEEEGYLKLFP